MEFSKPVSSISFRNTLEPISLKLPRTSPGPEHVAEMIVTCAPTLISGAFTAYEAMLAMERLKFRD